MTRQDGLIGKEGRHVSAEGGDRRLVGWKAIAASLGKDQRTAKRWALELGMPVHRVPGRQRASVYAFSEELEAWLRRDSSNASLPMAQPSSLPARKSHYLGIAAAAVLVLGIGGLAAVSIQNRITTPQGELASKTPVLSQQAERLRQDATYLWQKRTPEALVQSEALLLKVAETAPDFAGAQSDLATIYDLMVEYNVLTAPEGYKRARDAAERALRLNPDDAQAQAVLGDITFFLGPQVFRWLGLSRHGCQAG
jgi:hypothetical protein